MQQIDITGEHCGGKGTLRTTQGRGQDRPQAQSSYEGKLSPV